VVVDKSYKEEEKRKRRKVHSPENEGGSVLPMSAASLSPPCGKRRLGRKLLLQCVFFLLCCLNRNLPALSGGLWCYFFSLRATWLCALPGSFLLIGRSTGFFFYSPANNRTFQEQLSVGWLRSAQQKIGRLT
jgi:hypothetical protein